MPKQLKYNTGPFKDLVFQGHDDAEAYDKQAGETGSCVESADYNDWWRSGLPSAQPVFAKIIEEKSGVKRGTDEGATEKARQRAKDKGNVSPVEEKFVTYANRAKAGTDPALWKEIEVAVSAASAAISADSSPSARMRGPDKGAIAKAQDVLSRDEAGIEAAVEKMLGSVPNFDLVRDSEGVPEETSLARLVQEYMKVAI